MTRKLAVAISYCLAISVTAQHKTLHRWLRPPIEPFTVFAGGPARSIDLTTAFSDPDASNAVQQGVSLPSSTGVFTIALDGQYKPVTVGNFLNYVNFRRYFATDATSRRRIYRHGRFSRTRRLAHPPNGKLHCHCPGSWGNAYRARPPRDLSAIGRLLFSGSLHNLGEAAGIEAGAADECPINIRLRHQRARIFRFHAAAILDPNAIGRRRVRQLRKRFANKCVCFLRLLGCSITAGADSPDRLVGDDSFVEIFAADSGEAAVQLQRQNFFHTASLALL